MLAGIGVALSGGASPLPSGAPPSPGGAVWVWLTAGLGLPLLGFLMARHQAPAGPAASDRDPVTGFAPRSTFDRRCREEIARAQAEAASLAVLVIDVERLRLVYETLGREAGDRALRQVALGIALSSRRTDLPVRWGGDRFVMLAPGTTGAAAATVARRIQEKVARLLRERGGSAPPLGIAVGIADLERTRATPDELYAAATLALAHARSSSGRRGDAIALAPRRGTVEAAAVA